MNNRPRLILAKTKLDTWVERTSLCLLLLLWAFTFFAYTHLPDIVAIHFNGAGKPDGYGNKLTLFLLPVITTAVVLAIAALNEHPHLFNYTVTITEENAAQQYLLATRVLRFTNLGVVLLFLVILFSTYQTASGKSDGLGAWFFPVVVALSLSAGIVPLLLSARKS
jgi:uncharacterized membrane protein